MIIPPVDGRAIAVQYSEHPRNKQIALEIDFFAPTL
jgi:hypothetical protein